LSEITPRQLGELGLADSLERLRERVTNGAEPGPVLISLGDTLEWLYRLEKFHEQLVGATMFDTARRGDPNGETEGGFIYVRGLLAHGLAGLAALVTFPWPLVVGNYPPGGSRIFGSMSEYRWRSLAELPPPGVPEKHGRDRMYEQRVQGQPILPPLEMAKAYLEGLP
jgi:hypothetical protein